MTAEREREALHFPQLDSSSASSPYRRRSTRLIVSPSHPLIQFLSSLLQRTKMDLNELERLERSEERFRIWETLDQSVQVRLRPPVHTTRPLYTVESGFNPSSPVTGTPTSPLMPATPLDENSLLSHDDCGKSTAIGALNEPLQNVDEQEYLEYQQDIDQENTAETQGQTLPATSSRPASPRHHVQNPGGENPPFCPIHIPHRSPDPPNHPQEPTESELPWQPPDLCTLRINPLVTCLRNASSPRNLTTASYHAERAEFAVPRQQFNDASPVFHQMIRDFENSQQGGLILIHYERPLIFHAFMDWLVRREMPVAPNDLPPDELLGRYMQATTRTAAPTNSSHYMMHLVDLYNFAERWHVPLLKIAALRELAEAMARWWMYPGHEIFYIYNNTAHTSPLRKLAVCRAMHDYSAPRAGGIHNEMVKDLDDFI
ncbi:hypothetical protein HDK64DRAFT_300239 [Phyllosticta capitalensis]